MSSPSPEQPRQQFWHSPLGITIPMLASTVVGAVIKDRLSVEAIDTRMTERSAATDRRLDDLRVDLHDLKAEMDQLVQAIIPRPAPKPK